METDDRPTPENPNRGTSDEQAANPPRSFDCTFCKRGFSNAQALGGHMNIHRREKAKLKQSAASSKNSNLQSLDIPTIPPFYLSTRTTVLRPSMEIIELAGQKASTTKRPWFLGDEENDATESDKTQHGEVRQLPLFVERQISSIDQNPGGQIHASSTENGLSSSSSESELDLELRLGPEPEDSTSASATKRFF